MRSQRPKKAFENENETGSDDEITHNGAGLVCVASSLTIDHGFGASPEGSLKYLKNGESGDRINLLSPALIACS